MGLKASDVRDIKAKKGCALRIAAGCFGENITMGNAVTKRGWRPVPACAATKTESGYSCKPCYDEFLTRRKSSAGVEKEPEPTAPRTRSKRSTASPLQSTAQPQTSPLQPAAEKKKLRAEVERLSNAYRQDRPNEPLLDVAAPRRVPLPPLPDDGEELDDVPDAMDEVAAPDPRVDAAVNAPTTAGAIAVDTGFVPRPGRIDFIPHAELVKEVRHWRHKFTDWVTTLLKVEKLEDTKRELAKVYKEKEALEAEAEARLEDEGEVAQNRAEAKRLLRLNGIEDFCEAFDRAIVTGSLAIKEGKKRIMALYLEASGRCMNAKTTNLWKGMFGDQLKKFWAMARSMLSGRSCVEFVRGIMGAGMGTTAPKVDETLRVNLFGVSSDRNLRKTLADLAPDDEGACGIFDGAIETTSALANYVFLKADETDIAARLGETRDGHFFGDADTTAFLPGSKDPRALESKFRAIWVPVMRLLEDPEVDSDLSTFRACLKSAEAAVGLAIPKFRAAKVAEEKKHAELQKTYQERRAASLKKRKTQTVGDALDLHNTQWVELMKITSKIADAVSSETLASSFLADAAVYRTHEAAGAFQDNQQLAATQLVHVARKLLEVVPLVFRADRVAAKKLLAVFMHSADHTVMTCVGRFFVEKALDGEHMRKLYDVFAKKIKGTGENVKLLGLGCDGAYSAMLHGIDGFVTNLSQLASEAKRIITSWKRSAVFRKRGHSGAAAKIRALRVKWAKLLADTAQLGDGQRTPAREPVIRGWRERPVDRDAALEAWASQWRKLRSSPRETWARMKIWAKKKTPLQFLYEQSRTGDLPEQEDVVLNALQGLRRPESEAKLLELAFKENSNFDGNLAAQRREIKRDHPKFEPNNRELRERAALAWAVEQCEEAQKGADVDTTALVAAATALVDAAQMDFLICSKYQGLRSHLYVPEIVDGDVRIFHECCSHKIKNFGQGLQGQDAATMHDLDPVQLSKMCEAAEREPVHVGLLGFCVNAFDRQMDAPYKAVAESPQIIERLLRSGCYSEALVLSIIGEAQQAWTLPGLDQLERSIRLWRFSYLNFCLFGDTLFLPTANKGHKVQGLSPDALLAMHANADGRVALLKNQPEMKLIERSLSNLYDLERYFSQLVQRCGGYKPDARTAEGAFRTIDAVIAMRLDLNREFHMAKSKRSKKDIADDAKEAIESWNDGSKLAVKSSGFLDYIKDLEDQLRKACSARVASIRERFKVRSFVA